MRKALLHGAAVGALAAGVAAGLFFTGALNWLEHPLWDWRVRALADTSTASDSIRLIFLDQTSLAWGERENQLSWPWPRPVYNEILDFCRRGPAKSVVFDVLFTEPSERPDDDTAFARAIGATTGFVGTIFLGYEQGEAADWPADMPGNPLSVRGLEVYTRGARAGVLDIPRAAFPMQEIAAQCDILGNVYAVRDPDTVIRRAALFHVFDDRFIPSLALAAFLAAHPGTSLDVDGGGITVGDRRVPLDRQGKTIPRYRGPTQTHRTVSAQAVINSELRLKEGTRPELDPSLFRDAYVFFGFTAPGTHDLKASPISTVYPGVEIHATMLDNLLAGDFMRDADPWMVLAMTVLFGLLCGVCGRACQTGWHAVAAFGILLPFPVLWGFAMYGLGTWFPIAPEFVTAALALTGTLILNYTTEGRQRRFIKNAFSQYLSPVVIDQLVRDPGRLTLGGESRVLTILFSDVEGFTSISERLSPEQLTALLNDYLSAMTDVILGEVGTVDKYEGDAIIAFWNAPVTQQDHALRAVRTALHCQQRLAELRPGFKERVGRDVYARIGINSGPVVVGNMGSQQRFDYTFIGDAGNLASRLEGLNKQFGTHLLVSEYTRGMMGDAFPVREVSRVRVVGRQEPVRVYEPFLPEDFTAREAMINTFTRGLRAYYDADFRSAIEAFSEISDGDPAAASYVRRCRQLIDEPPGDWDGVWVASEK